MAPITSIVANIVGDRADVEGIVPEGTNSHTFEPRPSVAELLSTADVVYINGLQLEEPTKDLANENLKEGADIVELGTETIPESEYIYDFSFPKEDGKPNPHLWTDPTLARRYAELVKDDVSERDPANAGYYAQIVHDKAVRRRLVDASIKIAQLGYAGNGDVAQIVDLAQQTVYEVAEGKTSEDYKPLSQLLEPTIDEIEAIEAELRDAGVPEPLCRWGHGEGRASDSSPGLACGNCITRGQLTFDEGDAA